MGTFSKAICKHRILFAMYMLHYCDNITEGLLQKIHRISDDFIFTARRVCIARTMPWQDVRLSVRLSVTRQYCV